MIFYQFQNEKNLLQLLQLRDDFQESLEMSTYLVAFVVCDYNRITRETQKKVSVSVYAPNDMLSQANFALSTAANAMDYYDEFFGVPYPLPKQGKLNCFCVFYKGSDIYGSGTQIIAL